MTKKKDKITYPALIKITKPVKAKGVSLEGQEQAGETTSTAEAKALETMGLGLEVDLRGLRRRYSELVRRYHPDRNGGDRQHEARLNRVVEAYQLLRKSGAFVSGAK